MTASARRATPRDRDVLLEMYVRLEEEMSGLSPMWPLVSGLVSPQSVDELIVSPRAVVLVGEYEGVPFGFLIATIDEMLPAANGERLGSIRYVFVEPEAREVGVGEEMLRLVLELLRAGGIGRFDAHVLPGHRLAKNFFEQGGFAARHIIMHHDDARS